MLRSVTASTFEKFYLLRFVDFVTYFRYKNTDNPIILTSSTERTIMSQAGMYQKELLTV